MCVVRSVLRFFSVKSNKSYYIVPWANCSGSMPNLFAHALSYHSRRAPDLMSKGRRFKSSSHH